MKYTKEDIKFDQITPRAFENLCYDLIVKYGFHNMIWREGGADNGRDIEASYSFNNPIKPKDIKWFFECKHYVSGGVPPEHLNSKIAWADAERPAFLVLFISSYLTNNARTWLEKLVPQKQYDIICIEGEQMKDILVNYSELVERYFSLNRYEQMLKDIKDYEKKFGINPSFEILKEIIDNIDLNRLDDEDIAFILFGFYKQYSFFKTRNDYYNDFRQDLIYRVLDFLMTKVTNETLDSFAEYKGNYDELGGEGVFEQFYWLDEDEPEEAEKYDFQYYVLHLNDKKTSEYWKHGEYLCIFYKDVAFELFRVEKTQIRIIRNFSPEKIFQLSLDLRSDIVSVYDKYLKQFEL